MSTKINQTIPITQEDLIYIYGDEYQFFISTMISNCNCVRCESHYHSTIVNYNIFLYESNDILLKGSCQKCGHLISRYLETGEVPAFLSRINKVRSNNGFH